MTLFVVPGETIVTVSGRCEWNRGPTEDDWLRYRYRLGIGGTVRIADIVHDMGLSNVKLNGETDDVALPPDHVALLDIRVAFDHEGDPARAVKR